MKQPVRTLTNKLKEKKLTISFAESMTCGLLSHKMGTVKGTSDFFRGSIVCYNERVKISVLKIRKSLIDTYTAESQQVTEQLATNLQRIIPADICAAVTGLATAENESSKGAGTVYFAFVYKRKLYKAKKKFNGRPLIIREKAMNYLFRFISKSLK